MALVAISAVLLMVSTALIFYARSGPQPDAPTPSDDEATTFVPALVESDTPPQPESEVPPSEPEQRAEVEPEPPSLHEVEALSEEAVELGYDIEELNAEQGAGGKKKSKRKTLKPASLIVVANFDITDVTVNGLPYPEYFEDEKDQGMVLPAGGPYTVNVIYSGKTKTHTLGFKPYETRYLVADIPGYAGTSVAPSTPPPAKPNTPEPAKAEEKKEEGEKDEQAGRITIYAKPRGDILLDGKEVGQKTPNTIESPDGRHEVQVKYEDGELSEKKVVRVRKGSRIKLFFRQRKDKK
jgi:hypothetical protein